MTTFDDLHCAHVEQLGFRYPDAYHIRRGWAADLHHIESKVFLGDNALVFTSAITPEGTIEHSARRYKIARSYGLFLVRHALRRLLYRLKTLYGQY